MEKLNRYGPIVAFWLAVLVGSFVNFYATNLVLSDISNMYGGLHDNYIIASIPMLLFAIQFIIGTLYISRLCLRPNSRKSLTKLYLIIQIAVSFLGIVTSILSGTIVYHSFVKENPFPGYSLIFLIFYLVAFVLGLLGVFYVKNHMPEDTEKKKVTLKYSLYTLVLGIFMFFVYNRLGCILWMPSYVQGRTFYMTWPYYLWLFLPVLILGLLASQIFNKRKKGTLNGIIAFGSICVVSFALTGVVLWLGMTNTQYVSAISPTVGVERLLAKPVDTILEVVLIVVFDLFFLIQEIVYFRKNKRV